MPKKIANNIHFIETTFIDYKTIIVCEMLYSHDKSVFEYSEKRKLNCLIYDV